jgi:predicted nucleic acid-binding protein
VKSPDSSALIAAFAEWHEAHDEARASISGARLIGHTMFEFVSVLSRLPEPHRVEPRLLIDWLNAVFGEPPLVLNATETKTAIETLVANGVFGGAMYDGLIAITARTHRATLLSLDERAMRTYQRLDVDVLVPRQERST